MVTVRDSEVRLYKSILDRLAERGWNTKPPRKSGQVFTQNEINHDARLKEALGGKLPENVVIINRGEYWVIEAKSSENRINQALIEAKEYAELINTHNDLSCRVVTGIAGEEDGYHHVATHCLGPSGWQPLEINGRETTGFVSRCQILEALANPTSSLGDYEIDEPEFLVRAADINKILHDGGVNKRNRAGVLACLLLALAEDLRLPLSPNPTTMVHDINTRAESMLVKHKKETFFGEIKIKIPSSPDNHTKHRDALAKTILGLRDINIASAVGSGMDVLGSFYEQFLKYANDAKELGIVFTPRHITVFAAAVLDISEQDKVFDPACGTGGFLVSALDKVSANNGGAEKFKKGNLFGIEQDPLIAALAIVNMIFRGDGSSNIREADSLKFDDKKRFTKVLMNPPFALKREQEWKFVDVGLHHLNKGGLLFAVVPTTLMNSADDSRGELSWRKQMLNKHTLIAVIKLPEDLFMPQVNKGTYGIIIKAHQPHEHSRDVIWAVLYDGQRRTKTKPVPTAKNNIDEIIKAIKNYYVSGSRPRFKERELDTSPIFDWASGNKDLSPENYIDRKVRASYIDLTFISQNMEKGRLAIEFAKRQELERIPSGKRFKLSDFIEHSERGQSGRKKELPKGDLPLVSTSEMNNGISGMVDPASVNKVYPRGTITISANGASCCALYHEYPFAANQDVHVLTLKEEFCYREFAVFLCATINRESWRYNYYRKFSQQQFSQLEITLPTKKGTRKLDLVNIDMEYIKQKVEPHFESA